MLLPWHSKCRYLSEQTMSEKNPKNRLPYAKPEMTLVTLLQNEAVLAACKTSGVLRATGSRCDNHQGMCLNKTQGS